MSWSALLATLVLIFAFQADNITGRFFHVLLIAVPITLQVYLNAGLTYGLMIAYALATSMSGRLLAADLSAGIALLLAGAAGAAVQFSQPGE